MKKLLVIALMMVGISASAQTYKWNTQVTDGINMGIWYRRGTVTITSDKVIFNYKKTGRIEYTIIKKKQTRVKGPKGFTTTTLTLSGPDIDPEDTRFRVIITIQNNPDQWTRRSGITLQERDLFAEETYETSFYFNPKTQRLQVRN